MTALQKIIGAIALMAALFLLAAGVAAAATRTVDISGVTDHSIYQTGETVHVSGTVNGDVICAGQTVTINATVNGDVICAGQNVTVSGNVRGSVRLAGQSVSLGANVDRSASIAAQTFVLEGSGRVGGDMSALTQSATLHGGIGRDLTGSFERLILRGQIGRDVNTRVERLTLHGSAKVLGNITYTSQKQLETQGNAVVGGKISHHAVAKKDHSAAWSALRLLWSLYVLLALIIFSMVLVALFPQWFRVWIQTVYDRPWWALLTGFLASLIMPVVFIALLVSILGAPLALFLLLIWIVLSALALPMAAYYLGRLMLRNEMRSPLLMLAGVVVLGLVGLIPYIGTLVSAFAYWFGLGSLLINLRSRYRRPVYSSK